MPSARAWLDLGLNLDRRFKRHSKVLKNTVRCYFWEHCSAGAPDPVDWDDMKSEDRSSTSLAGPATVDEPVQTSKIDAHMQTLFALCNQARELVDEPVRHEINVKTLEADLDAFVAWCSLPLPLMVRQVLDHPKNLIPADVCPILHDVLVHLQRCPYKRAKSRQLANLNEGKRESQKYESKLRMQIVSMLSHLAKCRNERANPPWMVMRSIERIYHGMPESDWEGLTKERLLVDRTGLRRAMRAVSDWRPEPSFCTDDRDYVSTEYTLIAHDNKEWRLCYKWERLDSNGKLQINPWYHSVTSESLISMSCVCVALKSRY